jgi:hypothetical protein
MEGLAKIEELIGETNQEMQREVPLWILDILERE